MTEIEVRDLTADDGDLESEPFPIAHAPILEPFNLEKEQEKVRGRIAQSLVAMLAIVVLLAFLTLWVYGSVFSDLEKLMTIIFGPVITLVGTATGYYFGGKAAQNGASIK